MSLGISSADRRAEWLYPLSSLGAHLGFIPLLMLLLPRRVMAIAPGHALATLSELLLLGGIIACLANIAAGAIGDFWMARHGSRRAVIAAGLAGLMVSYGLLAQAATVAGLATGIVCFQLALNLMLSPMGALMADYVPDTRKGRIGGLLNAGLPLSILMVAVLARYASVDGPGGFAVEAVIVAGLVLPLLVFWPFPARQLAPQAESSGIFVSAATLDRRDLVYAAAARLLMQLGASLLVNYLYLYVAELKHVSHFAALPDINAAIGWLALVASGMAIVGAMVAGHGSDAYQRRRSPMIIAAIVAAAALALVARPCSWIVLLAAYGMFHGSLTAYLAIDTALVAQLIGRHPRRGTYLGLMNLTNTAPMIIASTLALVSATQALDELAMTRVVLAAAVAAGASAILVGRIRSIR